ncbi:MAG: hypothetical protein J3K34DRAFT_226635 [Monoraphidium minutum]|nr:MAG: hypothetical protein J3K34DRAFT_226635 [Monoraphidium minutum]
MRPVSTLGWSCGCGGRVYVRLCRHGGRPCRAARQAASSGAAATALAALPLRGVEGKEGKGWGECPQTHRQAACRSCAWLLACALSCPRVGRASSSAAARVSGGRPFPVTRCRTQAGARWRPQRAPRMRAPGGRRVAGPHARWDRSPRGVQVRPGSTGLRCLDSSWGVGRVLVGARGPRVDHKPQKQGEKPGPPAVCSAGAGEGGGGSRAASRPAGPRRASAGRHHQRVHGIEVWN